MASSFSFNRDRASDRSDALRVYDYDNNSFKFNNLETAFHRRTLNNRDQRFYMNPDRKLNTY